MHRATLSKKVLIAAVLLASTHGSSAEPRGTAFSVDAVPAEASQLFDPKAELLRLQSKYPTTSQIERRQDDGEKQQGSAVVVPQSGGMSFLVPTIVGNQTFNMLYDTGSADFWIYSNESSIYQSLEHPVYIPTSSATLLPNYTWSIKYAGGSSVSGVVFTDTVEAGSVVAQKQAVQAATVIPYEFGPDGIMGLASSTLNQVLPEKQATFFDTIAPTLDRKLFAANFRVNGNGTWDFGFLDSANYQGEVTYTPVVGDQKHWTIAIGEYAVGDGSFSTSAVGEVIVDSGSSLAYLPDQVVEDYYSQIEGYELTQGGSHSFPCNSTVPDLNFKIEGKTFTFPGEDVNYSVINPKTGTCAGAITTKLNMKYAVLGSMFMRNYYVVHSWEDDKMTLGIASR